MPYTSKGVELTMELVESFGFPTPPTEFKASPLFRGHSWNESEVGYELFRRVQYYGSLPAKIWKGTECTFRYTEQIEKVVERVVYDVDLGPIQDKYNAIQRTLRSLLHASGLYDDVKSTYFEDMRKLYNRHGDLYKKSNANNKSHVKLVDGHDLEASRGKGANLNLFIKMAVSGDEDRTNEAIITYDKSMPGILPGNGMAKYYYNKYNDGLVELDSIPNNYREYIINNLNIKYEVVQ